MRVELFERTNKKKGNTLCLLMYYGSETVNGKKKLKRKVESLNLYLNSNAKNEQEKRENKQKWRIAQKIRAEREMQLLSGKYDIILEEEKQRKKRLSVQLLPYMQKMIDERKKKGIQVSGWDGAKKHLKLFCKNNLEISIADVDKKFLLDYQNYLNTTTNTKGEKPLLKNSRCSYYNKLHITLRTAYEENLIDDNPCKNVKPIKSEQTERTYLTLEEIQAMANTDCRCKILKQAFLFSCYTGMRWSDINLLLWKQVVEENGNYKIKFRQKKTKKLQYLNINQQAYELLGERQDDEQRVFKGLRYSTEMNNRLLKWAMDSGISKWVTFHVARHTHATLLLTHGADLYVVSKLLGHSEIRTTQIYCQVIDKKRQEAVDLLPRIDFKL